MRDAAQALVQKYKFGSGRICSADTQNLKLSSLYGKLKYLFTGSRYLVHGLDSWDFIRSVWARWAGVIFWMLPMRSFCIELQRYRKL